MSPALLTPSLRRPQALGSLNEWEETPVPIHCHHPLRREVYTDALIHNIPAAHSLALCFFVGPIGLLSHSITRALVQQARKP